MTKPSAPPFSPTAPSTTGRPHDPTVRESRCEKTLYLPPKKEETKASECDLWSVQTTGRHVEVRRLRQPLSVSFSLSLSNVLTQPQKKSVLIKSS